MERWQPFRDMMTLREAMDDLLAHSVVDRGRGQAGRVGGVPIQVDLHETTDGYELCAALPGWRPDEVDVTLHGDTVTISGRRETPPEPEGGSSRTYHLRERRFGSFARSFSFPTPIDPDGAQARFEHGELMLHIPKAARARPRRIAIGSQPGAGSSPTLGRPTAAAPSAAGAPSAAAPSSPTTVPIAEGSSGTEQNGRPIRRNRPG